MLAVMVIGYGLLFGWLSLERYWTYQMHALDMGNMAQAAWNTVHGHPFWFTNMRLPYNIEAWNTTTRLSFHVEALFPVISLVYLVYPHPESLLVLQTAWLALGAIPVYWLARDILSSRLLGMVFALVYLLFPTVEALNLYEFHLVSLATPLLLLAFWFARRRLYGPFMICCMAAMGTKEEIGLVVAMFGLYVALVQRDRNVGLSTATLGIGWSLFAALVIEKHFRQAGSVSYMHTRYSYLGHGLHGALSSVLHHPGAIAGVIFTWRKLDYLLFLLAPVGFLALLAPAYLLLAAPTIALNVASQDLHMYSGVGDNSAEVVSLVVIAAIFGARRLLHVLEYRLSPFSASYSLGAVLVLTSLWVHHLYGFSPLSNGFTMPSQDAHERLADRFVAMVPQALPVSTQDQLDPHLSSRRYLYLFRDTGRDPHLKPADYVLLDVSAPTYPLPSFQLHDGAVDLLRHGWGVVAAQDALILLKRGAPTHSLPSAFYRYAVVGNDRPAHRLHGSIGKLRLLGYNVAETDRPNHRIPVLAYTVYVRLQHRPAQDLEPVVYEMLGKRLLGCASQPLGLAWFPTSRWSPGRAYKMRLNPLETNTDSFGTARLRLELRPVPADLGGQPPSCGYLWARHGKLWSVGRLELGP